VPGVRAPVATIGIGEKGEINLALSVATAGGHSSMPPDWTAIGRLSRAVDRLERHPFPASLDGATRELFENVGREMDWPFRILFANLWLFRPIVERYLLSAPTTAATIRTTLAPTIIEGGTKENVLAAHARAVINLRIRPGETAAGVTERIRRIVDDSAVRIVPVEPGTDPSPISPVGTAEYEAIATAVRQVHPEAVVAPFLVIAQTDARHYAGLTPNIYRFSPVTLAAADLARVHGTDERIAVPDYARAIRFYGQLMLNVAR
jgi:carboxypeptidase PM20D1